jgi:hypothetical protein
MLPSVAEIPIFEGVRANGKSGLQALKKASLDFTG